MNTAVLKCIIYMIYLDGGGKLYKNYIKKGRPNVFNFNTIDAFQETGQIIT